MRIGFPHTKVSRLAYFYAHQNLFYFSETFLCEVEVMLVQYLLCDCRLVTWRQISGSGWAESACSHSSHSSATLRGSFHVSCSAV